MTPMELRRLAHHLGTRRFAPSLNGYALVDGLLAAADLLEGLSGPVVHDDADQTSDAFPPLVALETLRQGKEP